MNCFSNSNICLRLSGKARIPGEMERMGNEVSAFNPKCLCEQALVWFSWKMHINCALEQKWMHVFFFMLLHLCSGTALGSRRRTSWMTGWFWGLSKSECSCFIRSPVCALSNQSLDFYLFISHILAPILKSLKHVCSVPLPPFTFLSRVLVLNYFQCLFL